MSPLFFSAQSQYDDDDKRIGPSTPIATTTTSVDQPSSSNPQRNSSGSVEWEKNVARGHQIDNIRARLLFLLFSSSTYTHTTRFQLGRSLIIKQTASIRFFLLGCK